MFGILREASQAVRPECRLGVDVEKLNRPRSLVPDTCKGKPQHDAEEYISISS